MSLYPALNTLSIIHRSSHQQITQISQTGLCNLWIQGQKNMNNYCMYARRRALALVLFIAAFITGAAQEKSQCNVKVTLLQVNDVYQFAPVDQGKAGGLGRVLTLKKSIQQQNPNTLLLMA